MFRNGEHKVYAFLQRYTPGMQGAASAFSAYVASHAALLLGLAYLGMLLSHAWWESGMAMHMGVLLPLLSVWGGAMVLHLRRRRAWLTQWGRRYRVSLLLFAIFTLSLWMLPRLLDASLYALDMAALKWLTLPLAGAALVLCWRALPWLLRAVLQLEAIATLLRLGWLYLVAPQTYCVSYGIDDQQRLAYLLIVYAAVYGGVLGLRVMFGRHPRIE